MKLTKRIFSSVMALLIAFSVFSVGFTTVASAEDGAFFEEIVLKPIDRPVVSFSCTTITRVAKAANSMEPGNKIVKATPSGVPELSGSYASQAYAGETPSATKITFKAESADVTPTKISCSNESVVLSDLAYNNSTGAYTCEVKSGAADAGSAIVFTIDYTWTDGNTYQEKCVTFVEGIANGGSFAEAKCDITSRTSLFERYVAQASANTRVLGRGVYYEQPAGISSNPEHPYRSYGVYNPATGQFIENVASGYNTSIYKDDHTEDVWIWRDQTVEFFATDTAIAHIYIDSSSTTKLSDLGLRININVGELIDTGKSVPYTAIADTWVSTGTNIKTAVTTNNSTAQNTLGITIPAKKEQGVTQFEKGAPLATVTKGVGSFKELYTYRLTGSVSEIVDGSSYTVTSKYYSYMFNDGLLGYNLTSSATVPTAMVFHVVDKGALRDLVDYVMTSDPTTPSTRTQQKGADPQAWYYRSGFSQFQTAYTDALRVLNNPKATQSEIDSATKSLQTMYNNLQLKTADYSRVNELYDLADEIIKNEDTYAPEDIAVIKEAQVMVTKSYSILYQGAVDTMARNLQKAIDNANPSGADYKEIYELKVQFEELDKNDYEPDSWQAVEDALNAVDYTKSVLEQDDVDAMAQVIKEAFENLVLIPADFTSLESKLVQAKEINRTLYANSSILITPIEDAEFALADNEVNPWGKARQNEVDGLVKALDDAINALVPNAADKAALKNAIDEEIPGELEYYNQDILSEYNNLLAEGTEMYNDDTLTVLDQAEIDEMTAVITSKYAELMESYDDSCRHPSLNEAVVENEVAPGCETAGSYDVVIYCSDCGEEVTRETIPVDALGHTEAEDAVEENRVDPTCTEKGSYDVVFYCDVCGEELRRFPIAIKALGHTPAEAVEKNRAEADCVNAGSYDMVVYCSVCGEELSCESFEIEALGHEEAEPVEENRIEATFDSPGSYDSVVYCKVCGEELSRETVEISQLNGYFKATEGTTTVIDEELGYIYGLDIGLSDLEGYVEYSENVTVEITDGVGTGSEVITYLNGEVWETYMIVIFGDLNGDGVLDIYDASILAAIVNGDMELEEGDVILFASDLNGDTAIDIYDLAILNAVVNGETEIAQTPFV